MEIFGSLMCFLEAPPIKDSGALTTFTLPG